MPIDLRPLHAYAERQHGLVRRTQLARADITASQRRRLVSAGHLVAVGTRAFRLAGSPQTDLQRVLAGCYDVAGWTTASTAAALHGLGRFSLDGDPQVVVRKDRRHPASDLARVHTSTWLPSDDLTVVSGIPTLSVARTLLSLAALAPEIGRAAVRDAVEEAIRDGKASPAWIRQRLEGVRRRGRNGVILLEEILDDWELEPTESWLENEVLRIVRDAELPTPSCQQRVPARDGQVARVDFWYPELRAILEASGYRYHRTVAQTDGDAARRRRLTAEGFDVYEFTYGQLTRSPEDLVELVSWLHRTGGRRLA